ncbi:MAG: YfhO family protein [Deltaproteobacteria bacterium]|nr:YfhO family protein [Deltaproteobacteria bacterium]
MGAPEGPASPPATARRRLAVPAFVLDLACVAALITLAAFHLRDPLFAGRFPVSEEYDTLILQYPAHHALDDALSRGELPWWTPEAGNGLPLVAEGEAGALYPPNLLLFGLLPPFEAYALSLLLALAALGIGTFGLARTLGAARPGALLAGASLMLSGFALGHEHHLSLLRTAALLPWLLWVAEACARKPRLLLVAFGAAVVALQWLAGNPQLAHLSTIVLLVWLPARAAMESTGDLRARLHAAGLGLGAATGMIVAGLLLAGIQLVPSALYARETVRSGGLSLADATVVGFPARDLMLFLDPNAFGTPLGGGFKQVPGEANLYWESLAYVGLLPLLLAPVAFFRRERRGTAILLGTLAAAGVVIALGRHSPVFRALFAVVPGFDLFRVPQRWLFVTALGLVLLGALALTWTAERLAQRWSPRGAVAVAFALAALAAYDVGRVGDRTYPTVPLAELEHPSATVAATGGGAILAVPIRGNVDPKLEHDPRGGGWFGRDAMALVSHSLNVAWRVRSPLMYVGLLTRRSQHFEKKLVDTLAASLGPDGTCRPGATWTTAVAASGAQWVTSFVPIDAPGLVPAFLADAPGYLRPVRVYRVADARSRAALVERVRPVADEASALDGLFRERGAEPLQEIVVEVPRDAILPAAASSAMATLERGAVRVVRDEPTRIELEVDTPRDAWVVTTDAALAGWTAEVDGAQTSLFPADVLSRAAWVPAGRHRVVFSYDPPGRTTGWVLTGLGVAALLGLVAVDLLRRRRETEQ